MCNVTGALRGCRAIKFDSRKNLWSFVHTVFVTILRSVSLKIKRKCHVMLYSGTSIEQMQNHVLNSKSHLDGFRMTLKRCHIKPRMSGWMNERMKEWWGINWWGNKPSRKYNHYSKDINVHTCRIIADAPTYTYKYNTWIYIHIYIYVYNIYIIYIIFI